MFVLGKTCLQTILPGGRLCKQFNNSIKSQLLINQLHSVCFHLKQILTAIKLMNNKTVDAEFSVDNYSLVDIVKNKLFL